MNLMPDGSPRPSPLARVPPNNLRAEESVLGAMLLSREAIAEVVEILEPDHFYKPAHGHLYEAILSLYSSGEPVDAVTVADELKRAGMLDEVGGPAVLLDFQANTPAISNAHHYAKIVEEHALLRRMISVSNEIAEMAYSIPEDVLQAVDDAEAKMFDVAQRRVTNTTAAIRDLLPANLDRIEMLYDRGEAITGMSSGYLDLDEKLAGLQPNALYVVGARPAMGKALALDTPLATPTGWTTMGEVQVGDQVFDETGTPCTVTYKSPVFEDHDCYEVVFDDGSVIVADADHLWETWVGSRSAVRTTAELAVDLKEPSRAVHRIPVAGALDCSEAELSEDPYEVGRRLVAPAPVYLRAGFKQRLALLQGVMDSAGYQLSGQSTCRLSLDERRPLELLRELALSLGYRADRLQEGSSPDGRPVWTLQFTPLDPVFRSAASAGFGERVPLDPGRSRLWRTIVDVRPVPSVPTQCITVDSPSHLYLAGREMIPTHNTAFALGMACNSAMKDRKPVLIFTLEMSQLELSQRLLCSEALVDSGKVKTGRLEEAEWTRISHAVGRLAEAPIYIDDNPHTSIMDIRAKARRLKSREGDLGMIVIDYIQLMSGRSNAESRQVEVSEISRNLKILARELEAPVIALAQLNRSLEQRTDKRPMLSDLRESGSLEQDADVVLFLYRDEVYDEASPDKGVAEVIVAKHRNGPTGRVRLAFRGQYTRFDNMARTSPPKGGGADEF